MTRRRIFDPATVPVAFWARGDIETYLANRDLGCLFRAYLAAFPDCTQTQLALLTEHDRADISNWVRGARQSRVSDIDVLTRIVEGLVMPDHARLLLGLAPADMLVTKVGVESQAAKPSGPRPDEAERHLRVAICGSRHPDCDPEALDQTVRGLARLVLARRYRISHGPVGVGIEVMTYIADHYRPPDFRTTTGIFGRINIVHSVNYVIVAGGGPGTQDELDLARSLRIPVLPVAPTGGAARRFHERALAERNLWPWITDGQLAAVEACSSVDDHIAFIESVLTDTAGAAL
ncbi:hypothetical protein [Streptomyces sp. SCSIO ZS0520]|uniref:hypothetical protein n=1 Tax=Streptomyces sp. SCSIO ZS0520 TaxID=2892996 RepID=UPI0021DB6135|nr:hypothetical protein [Streptomyces sp. SCSIO ZS0520]